MSKMVHVVILPEAKDFSFPEGVNIKDGVTTIGVVLDGPCGGRQICGKCRVRILEKVPPPVASEEAIFNPQELALGWRLGCVVQLQEGMVVEIPSEQRVEGQQILAEGVRRRVPFRPNVQKLYFEADDWSSRRVSSDLEGIREIIGEVRLGYPVLKSLPRLLGGMDGGVTGVVVGEELVGLELGDTTEEGYGVALDVGTTTLAAALVELGKGQQLATVSELNPQVALGEDVISRVNFCVQREDGLENLRRRVVGVVDRMVKELCAQAGIAPERVYELIFVGNTVMIHLLLGISPRGLARLPFRPVFTRSFEVEAGELGLSSISHARVQVPPLIAGFVGSDTVGVILATGLYEGEGVKLAVDLGTNGELALSCGSRLLVCATAAGPAFEGAHIEQGMRATQGAIDRVWMTRGEVGFRVIGGGPPRGICGSGLVDTVAEMLQAGLLDRSGTIRPTSELGGRVSLALRERIKEEDGGRSFVLSREPEVKVTQKDVREFQVAKAAIRAGIRILTRELGVCEEEVDEVFLCGAFGNFVSKESAIAIGLLPAQLGDRIKAVGNAAFEGAKLMLLSVELRRIARDIAHRANHVNLSEVEEFHREFIEAMRFPEQVEGGLC